MANYERGVYEPSDEVRVFDGSEEDDDVEGSRLPLLIVLALLVLAMFAGVVWLAYTQGVARGRGETPVLAAASGPERVAPPQGSGGTVPYQGFKIYEQPAPPDDSADTGPPAAAPKPAATMAAPAAKPAPPVPVAPAAKTAPVAAKPAAAPAAMKPAAKPAAAPPAKSVAALIQQANDTPVSPAPATAGKAATPPPAMKPSAAVAAAPAPAGGPATSAPRSLVPATPAPVAARPLPAPAAAKPAASGVYVLQIGAYKSQADAAAAWNAYRAKHAALLSGYSDDIQQADLGEKGTWYRLRVGGLADREVATALCDRLKADGGACILGRSMRSRAIHGCAGAALSPAEADFFRATRPWGFILFARNINSPEQVRTLIGDLRAAAGDPAAPVLIDQEGGRVARLKPPHWPVRPPAAAFGALYTSSPGAAREATYLNARLIAHDLARLGITVDCLPVLDVPVPGAHDIIGDRAFASDPATIIALGRAQIEGLLDGGVLPVMKHIPGHGRSLADSHLALPRVTATRAELSASDFVTFRSLDFCPLAMTAHLVYESIDPQRPATTSPKVIRDVIRGELGFDGLLMSDDLSMQALDGPLSLRARAALFAGCDLVLHCNADMDEMRAVASEVKLLEGPSLRRSEQALGRLNPPTPFDPAGAQARLDFLLGAA